MKTSNLVHSRPNLRGIACSTWALLASGMDSAAKGGHFQGHIYPKNAIYFHFVVLLLLLFYYQLFL